jgi:hypothetical protein
MFYVYLSAAMIIITYQEIPTSHMLLMIAVYLLL